METKKTVYFVRHGQSVANVSSVFQPPDSPLNEIGREQARSIARRTLNIPFEILIASPFQRAKETAEIIADVTGKKPEYSDLFVERLKPTNLVGKSYEDKEADVLWREWNKSLYTAGIRAEDGENFDRILARADKALEFLKERPEKNILVVTHGYFLRTMVARVLLGDLLLPEVFKRFQRAASMENTGITVLRYQGAFEEEARWRLWIYNDHAHLG